MRPSTCLNVPSFYVDYSYVASGDDATLINPKSEFLLCIAAVVSLDVNRVIFSYYSICGVLDLLNFFLTQRRMVGYVKPAVILFFKGRVLPYPRAKCISRCGIYDMGRGVVFCNKIPASCIHFGVHTLSFFDLSLYFVDYYLSLFCHFDHLGTLYLTGIRFLTSTTRKADPPGALIEDWGDDIEELGPLEVTLQLPRGEDEVIPVTLESHVTEVGTLELWCVARDRSHRWKLELNIRERTD